MSAELSKNQKRRARLQQQKKERELIDAAENDFLDSLISQNAVKTLTASATSNVTDVKDVKEHKDATGSADNKDASTGANASSAGKPLSSAEQQLTVDEVVKKMDHMWSVVKKHIKETPDFKELDDKKKLDLFRTHFEFRAEMEEFPIVTKYMICLGQYRSKAFRRMLVKTRNMVHPPPEKRPPRYMEDQWICRSTDYVVYLWEEYQKGPWNTAERNWVYKQTYESLKGEFDDFRDMHTDIEKKVQEEKKMLAGKNVRDLLNRLKTGKQSIMPEEEAFLRRELGTALVKHNYKIVLSDLKKARPETEPACAGHGKGEEVDERRKKITVIENGVLQPDQNVSDVPDKACEKPDGFVPSDDLYTDKVAKLASRGDNLETIVEVNELEEVSA